MAQVPCWMTSLEKALLSTLGYPTHAECLLWDSGLVGSQHQVNEQGNVVSAQTAVPRARHFIAHNVI
eukprot:5263795-Ditylum_brightwellii.AAC.1